MQSTQPFKGFGLGTALLILTAAAFLSWVVVPRLLPSNPRWDEFAKSQDAIPYKKVLDELLSGRKRRHWMWFVFPQLRELGQSEMARHYGLAGLNEARD